MVPLKICFLAVAVCLVVLPPSLAADATRAAKDLQALYTFDAVGGTSVRDRSEVEPPLDLKIEIPSAVKWEGGFLRVDSATSITSLRPATKIIRAVKRSNEVTIEAWIKPANDQQKGPARIVSLSGNSSQRNFTFGQEREKYDLRLRTTETDRNGLPSTSAQADEIDKRLTHVIYARDAAGTIRVYLDGQPQSRKNVSGSTSNWDNQFHLVLADEFGGGRPWLGEYHLVAIYSRALTASEVEQNFQAGASVEVNSESLADTNREHFFEREIAPLLATHCLECHDSATKKGGLDLSQMTSAFAGGETSKALVPGDAEESLLWLHVDSDEMPPESPLTPEEKKLLHQWIADGAVWTLDVIDPAVYAQDNRTGVAWLQRLTVPEYIETVRSAVGIDIEAEARQILPPDLRADGFSNTAYNLNVDLKHVEAYALLAELIVDRMDVMKFAAKFSKSRKLSTDATMRQFVADMGKWILRGPLDDREITNYSGIATTVASVGGDYEEAVRYLIEAMLQSPRFIYRMELQRGDGSSWPVNNYELASRISYILWGGPPDEELLRAADDGELYDPDTTARHVHRMLEDPRAIKRSLQFISQWLNLDRLNNLRPDPIRFQTWDNALAVDMREETLAFFKEIVWEQNRPLTDLFNAQITYASPRLAEYYGFEPKGPGLQRYDLSSVPVRGGLLTQGSVLSIGGDDASMVTRGLFVLQDVLRGRVNDPPPGLDTTPVPSTPGVSQRQIAQQRIANESCTGCHSKIEPLAFGLEMFDGLGAFHEKDEHGNALRDDGEILFPGTAEPVKYQTSAELMNLLAESERVGQTITWKVTQFALGRPLTATDARIVDAIHEASQNNGGTYASLIEAIVISDLVQRTNTEADHSEIAE